MAKSVCFTLDVEPDFAGLLDEDVYLGKKDLSELSRLIKLYNIKVTAFVTGKTLEDNPDMVDLLRNLEAEVEQHSYSHPVNHESKVEDIKKGLEVHERVIGKLPLGYRAPRGIISKNEVLYLNSRGIKYDASIFPTFFPRRFNRLSFPMYPFKIKGTELIEIPFSVVPIIRIPISLSYMQLLGYESFKFFFKLFGLPKILIYDFHTYELGKVSSYNLLRRFPKLGYYRAQRRYRNPSIVLEKFIKFILSSGYQSKYMSDIYQEIKSDIPTWGWSGD